MSAGQAILAGGAPHLNAMRLRRRALLEPLLVFLAAGTFYVALYGELPYHDVQRFVSQIESGRYVWDMGHVWLQPVTLLWHKYISTVFLPQAPLAFFISCCSGWGFRRGSASLRALW